MFNRFLKPYLPRSLFGRAVAILIVPIVLIQIVVGVVFVERLFQDVTRQMTRTAAIDVNYVLDGLADGKAAERGVALDIHVAPRASHAAAPEDRWRDIIDFSGAYVIDTFREAVPDVVAVDLGASRDLVTLTVSREGQPFDVTLARSRVTASNPHQLLVVMVLAAALLSIIAALFMRNQVKPIRRLAVAAEAFGKGQTLPLNPRGAAEVRSATNAFLSMRSRIERQIEQRTTMLSGVSHDLRTPLTRLRLSLSLMDEDDETALMHRDIDDMEQILEEFLAFARGDAGEAVQEVDVAALAEDIVTGAQRSGQDVTLSFEGAQARGLTTRMRKMAVRRAVSNLLSNARRFGAVTTMTVYLGQGFVEFIVEDDGPGIPDDQRDNAKRAFTRLDSARNQDQGSGVGLGLAIASDIARSHGGELTLGRSDALGGLKASLRLPR